MHAHITTPLRKYVNVKENRSYVRVADHQSDLHSHITTPLRKYVNVKENRSYVREVTEHGESV